MKPPSIHKHPYTGEEVYGSELEPGDLIQRGDLVAFRNGYVPTEIPNTTLKADNNNVYIRVS